MKSVLTAMTMISLSAPAFAGGIGRTDQPVDVLFQTGTFVELSFGTLVPTVSGSFASPGDSGNIAVAAPFQVAGLAFKKDFGDRLSLGLTVDQPFAAEAEYTRPGYPLFGTEAHFKTNSLSFLGLYRFNDAFSVIGGVRVLQTDGDVTLTAPAYSTTYSPDTDLAYVIGAAFEKPEIALRLAVTYSSATNFALKGSAGTASVDLPQSVKVDFQTGIAADTLLIASARWADWSHASITDSTAGPLITYNGNTVSYTIGLGRKFSDTWSGAVLLGYEPPSGDPVSDLIPTDGSASITVAGIYTRNRIKVTGGVMYRKLGDATTDTTGAEFSGNSALGVGMKVALSF
ncbi:MAG: transporter [bacterium]